MAHQRIRGDTLTSLRGPKLEATSENWATSNSALVNDAYAVQETSPPPTSSSLITRKRKQSKAKAVKSSVRSMSTPQMQRPGMSDSDIDKKRNKLGYQRISIACAHCRRRKIRCVVEDNDPHQRCQNCIRLKKECLFYPVEQQGAIEEKSQSSSKAGQSSTVSSSPGEIDSATTFDDEDSQINFPTLTPNIPNTYQGVQIPPGSAPLHQGSFSQRHFEYPPRSGSHSPWLVPNEFDPRMPDTRPSPVPYANQQQWHFNQVGSPGDFYPFPTDAAQQDFARQHATAPNYASFGTDHRWQQPVRSYSHEQMTRSVSNDEAMYMSSYPPFMAQGSVPLQMREQEGELHQTAVSQQQPSFQASLSPYHNSMATQPGSSQNWYHEPATYAQPSEEHIGTPTEDFTQYQR